MDAPSLLTQLQAAAAATPSSSSSSATGLEAVDVVLGTIHTVSGLTFAGANERAWICGCDVDTHTYTLRTTTTPPPPTTPTTTEAIVNLVQAAGATGLPTVLVTPSAPNGATKSATATTTATNAAARLALPALQAGETGRVALAGFAAQQPVALEMTTRCVLGLAGRDAGVPVGGFVPAPNGGGNDSSSGNGDVCMVL